MSTIPTDILSELELQSIELPSWAFGNSGTRFKVFATPGTPRDPYEKIADAAQVHKYTALAPTVTTTARRTAAAASHSRRRRAACTA